MHWRPNESDPMMIIHCKTPQIFLVKNEKQEKSECNFSSIRRRPQRNAHLRFERDRGEEDETIYIRSSMEGEEGEEEEEEEEDKAFLETCIEASCTPTRSPQQID